MRISSEAYNVNQIKYEDEGYYYVQATDSLIQQCDAKRAADDQYASPMHVGKRLRELLIITIAACY